MKRRFKNNIFLNSCVVIALMLLISVIILLGFKETITLEIYGLIGTFASDLLALFFGGTTNELTTLLTNFFAINVYVLIIILLFIFTIILVKCVYALLMRAFGRWRI